MNEHTGLNYTIACIIRHTDLHSLQRLMPCSTVGAVVDVAIAIPLVRCSTFPCHPNHSNSKFNQNKSDMNI